MCGGHTFTSGLHRSELRGKQIVKRALAGCAMVVWACAGGAAERGASPAGVRVWLTTADQSGPLQRDADLEFGSEPSGDQGIAVDAGQRYQEIEGFGAAITDATAFVVQSHLAKPERVKLLRELFGGDDGLALRLTRITIGGSDFSRRHYSLDDTVAGRADPGLSRYSIAPNREFLLPMLRAVRAINPRLRIIASPWSPPAWMKDSGTLVHGRLRAEAFPVFARYLVRFVDSYRAEGIPIYALTIQNEPNFEPADYPGMKLSGKARAEIIGKYLGPLLAQRRAAPLILDWDHNWDDPGSPLTVLADPQAARYVAGIAWHCYKGDVSAQGLVHDAHPDKGTYLTECSGGGWNPQWDRALHGFMRMFIGATRQWASGVVLWNLALDEHHGPHAGGCTDCRGVVTIDSRSGRVTRNVEYYVLAHFSRFVRPGARRIDSTLSADGVENVAFRNVDDGSIVVVAFNTTAEVRRVSMNERRRTFAYELPAGAVATFVWDSER
jgi:glucosylceramidase